MARFVTSLSQEQLYRLLMSLNGTTLPDGSRLDVKMCNWKAKITLTKKDAEGKENFVKWKGRILSRKDGSAIMRGTSASPCFSASCLPYPYPSYFSCCCCYALQAVAVPAGIAYHYLKYSFSPYTEISGK